MRKRQKKRRKVGGGRVRGEEEERNFPSAQDCKGTQDTVGLETTQKYLISRSDGSAPV